MRRAQEELLREKNRKAYAVRDTLKEEDGEIVVVYYLTRR